MSDLHQAVEDYIRVRRALGSKLERHHRLLENFAAYLEAAGARTVTTELALAWARLPGPQAHPTYVSNRLSVVRGFARHLQALDPATEVPPVRLLPRTTCRATPYLYSDAEIAALLTAARSLTPALRAATYETLIALLVVTGARVGELIRLDRDHVDWQEGVLVIWDSKYAKSRELALHPSTLDALRGYAAQRDRSGPASTTASFFMSQQAPGWPTPPFNKRSPAWCATPGWRRARIGAGPASTTCGTASPCAPCLAGTATASMCRPACPG